LTVRVHLAGIGLLALPLAASACGSRGGFASIASSFAGSTASALQPSVTSSDLAVGRNRFTFGVLDSNHPVQTPSARVTFFDLGGGKTRKGETLEARFNYFSRGLKNDPLNSSALAIGGVYVAYPSFSRAGPWGAVIRLSYRGHVVDLHPGFQVQAHTKAPAVGSLAPRSQNPTTAQQPATKLDSGRPPDDMHAVSIAAAIARHKPLVVLFATPAYCTSRMCGPQVEQVQALEPRFRGRVNFVHIEIYRNANPKYGYAPTVLQWHITTEPWVFVVDRHGRIAARFEGPSTAGEVRSAIDATLR
jgi:peroxiredoxin